MNSSGASTCSSPTSRAMDWTHPRAWPHLLERVPHQGAARTPVPPPARPARPRIFPTAPSHPLLRAPISTCLPSRAAPTAGLPTLITAYHHRGRCHAGSTVAPCSRPWPRSSSSNSHCLHSSPPHCRRRPCTRVPLPPRRTSTRPSPWCQAAPPAAPTGAAASSPPSPPTKMMTCLRRISPSSPLAVAAPPRAIAARTLRPAIPPSSHPTSETPRTSSAHMSLTSLEPPRPPTPSTSETATKPIPVPGEKARQATTRPPTTTTTVGSFAAGASGPSPLRKRRAKHGPGSRRPQASLHPLRPAAACLASSQKTWKRRTSSAKL
mmetsp:Transcript_14217/g.41886  ORF Transcript_14217/g.41886 Transcript_14217/m.41886 type:complete len:322 (-) Transcript_14217:726-1691(-)